MLQRAAFTLAFFITAAWARSASADDPLPQPVPPEHGYWGGYELAPPAPYVRAQSLASYDWDPPPPVHFDDRPWTFETMLGFGTPVGLLGGVLEYTPADVFSFGAGAGFGPGGLEGGVLFDVRPFRWGKTTKAHALSIGGAYSVGGWTDFWQTVDQGLSDPHYASGFAQWAQFDVGYELRARGGFSFRVATGAAWMLNPGNVSCRSGVGTPCTLDPYGNDPIFTLSVSIGYSLER